MDPDRIDPDITDKADKLIESYAAKIASRFLDRGLPYLDLCQAAALGLTKAARRFDPSYGVDFAVYSFKFIEGEIRSAVRKKSSAVL